MPPRWWPASQPAPVCGGENVRRSSSGGDTKGFHGEATGHFLGVAAVAPWQGMGGFSLSARISTKSDSWRASREPIAFASEPWPGVMGE